MSASPVLIPPPHAPATDPLVTQKFPTAAARSLVTEQRRGGVRIDAFNLGKTIGSGRMTLLRDVSLTLRPRELVAIVGASGAGKSTLLGALTGFSPATSGRVLLNGRDFYQHFDASRDRLGYVPQDDIVHQQLTVGQGLYYAAKLRLPDGTSETIIDERVAAVLNEVELTDRREVPIRTLSGGQRKRVSIAVELIAQPQLLYLDEPTSGLDPGLDLRLMLLLRELADEGRTVVLTTHATSNITVCDKVVFLARGGRLCFFGSPEEALTFFEAPSFAEIYAVLDADPGAAELWETRYRASSDRQRAIAEQEASLKLVGDDGELPAATGARSNVTAETPPDSTWRQFRTLTQRYVRLLWSDKPTLGYLIFQVPLMAMFLGLVSGQDVFADGQPFTTAQVTLTLLMVFALWVGANTASREIVKENPIYLRERLVNLQIFPYISSKVVVLAGINLIQSVLWVTVLALFTGLPTVGVFLPAWLELILTVWLIGVAGSAMALFISAASANLDLALSITPSAIIPQMLLAGALFALPASIGWMDNATIGKWGVNALGTTADLNHLYYAAAIDLPESPQVNSLLSQVVFNPNSYGTDPALNLAEVSGRGRLPHLLRQWGALSGWVLLFSVLACLAQCRKDRAWRT